MRNKSVGFVVLLAIIVVLGGILITTGQKQDTKIVVTIGGCNDVQEPLLCRGDKVDGTVGLPDKIVKYEYYTGENNVLTVDVFTDSHNGCYRPIHIKGNIPEMIRVRYVYNGVPYTAYYIDTTDCSVKSPQKK